MPHTSQVPQVTLWAYALPGFVLAMPTIPAYLFLPTLYAQEIGLAAAGLALLLARVVDVFTDPIVGALSDNTNSRWGRRKPWIIIGGIIAGLSLVQLFEPPQFVTMTYLITWSIFLYIGWTFINVPYTAWGAELSPDYYQRVRITSAREGLMVLGILAAGAMPFFAAQTGISEREGLAAISWLAVLLGIPFLTLLVCRVPESRNTNTFDPSRPSDRSSLNSLKKLSAALSTNLPFVRLLSAWFINGLANGIPAVLFLLFLDHGMDADQVQRSMLIFFYFLAAVLAIPFWLRTSLRIGKNRTWCIAMICTCLAFVWVPALGPGDIYLFAIICVVSGIGLGADLALPPALQADVVDYDTLRHGKARAGIFFALWSMATKLALALAVGITFPLLDFFGFSTDGHNAPSTLLVLAVIYSIVPVVMKIVSIFLIWNFPLTAGRQAIIRARLESRQQRAAEEA